MDKYEYKVRSEEIKALVDEKNYKEAAELADTIDWRRVKSVNMLCTISDVYKMVRRYEDSRALLLLADERRPDSKIIIYALTELSIKIGDIISSLEYYKHFCTIAPEDSRRLVLLYKIYVAQEVNPDEQIKVLEALKEEDYSDKWAYELAYLYHKTGLGTQCVEECDEIILIFGEGKYVKKAMELKMLHEPLTPKQMAMYRGEVAEEIVNGNTQVIGNLEQAMEREMVGMDPSMAPTIQFPAQDIDDIQVKTMDDSPYNTINLQKELAKNLREILDDGQPVWQNAELTPEEEAAYAEANQVEEEVEETVEEVSEEPEAAEENVQEEVEIPTEEEAPFDLEEIGATGEIILKSVEDSAESDEDEITRKILSPMLEETQEMPHIPDSEEIFFEEPVTTDMTEIVKRMQETSEKKEEAAEPVAEPISKTQEQETAKTQDPVTGAVKKVIVPSNPGQGVFKVDSFGADAAAFATKHTEFDHMLSQESDGQISLVVPEKEQIEKQITGQMSIEDILQEWERLKKEKEKQLKTDIERRVLEQTGDMFAEFDEASRQGLLETLQKASEEAEAAEARKAELEEEPQNEEPVEDDYAQEMTESSEADTEEAGQVTEAEEADAADMVADEAEAEIDGDEVPEIVSIDRPLTKEEMELFGDFAKSRGTRKQILATIDTMSLAAYTGNIIITGGADANLLKLAKNLIKELQMSDANFSGKAAKISGDAMNTKNPADIASKLKNGVLIIDAAGKLTRETANNIVKALQTENDGLLVLLLDTKKAISSLLKENEILKEAFNARIDVGALSDDALIAYGRKYAYEKEYAIDEMGEFALRGRITSMQTAVHDVTTADVRSIIKEAIYHSNRKNLKHFFDVLFGRRYDEEDMIVLREEDFA